MVERDDDDVVIFEHDGPASAFPLARGSRSIPGCCDRVGLARAEFVSSTESRSDSKGFVDGGRGIGEGPRLMEDGPGIGEGMGD